MKSRAALSVFVLIAATSLTAFSQNNDAPPLAGIHFAKGEGPANTSSGNSNPDLVYHSPGPIMPSVQVVTPIYWGKTWNNYTGDKMAGLQAFYTGMSGSAYAKTCNEYSDSANDILSSSITYGGGPNPYGAYVDTSAAARNGNSTSAILAEVCKMVGNNVQAGGYYPVYVDSPRSGSYCAWHSAGKCTTNGPTFQFAFFYNLDNDSSCDVSSKGVSFGGIAASPGLASLANVSGHEISETRTDPHLNAWYDNSGNENADKCAWTFGPNPLPFTNGSTWVIQGNWSNKTYDGGGTSAFAHTYQSTRSGCIDTSSLSN